MRMRMMRGLSIRFLSSVDSMKQPGAEVLQKERTAEQDTVLALLLFGLLREWLVPILHYSNVNGLREQLPFLAVIGVVLILDRLQIPQLLSWPVKLVFVCVAVQWAVAAGGGAPAEQPLVSAFALGIAHDARLMLGGDPGAAGPFSRTFLFLLGWSMLTSVLYSLMLHVRSGFWLVAVTWIFLLSLQYGTGEDMTDGIIRTLVLGLFLLALQRLFTLFERAPAKAETLGASGWWAAAIILAGLTVLLGWFGANRESREVQTVQWDKLPKPLEAWVSRWQGMSAISMFGPNANPGYLQRSTTGYGQDDTRLGGPLKQDQQVAFMAKTPELTYWRGESKDMYDGKGWRSSQSPKRRSALTVNPANVQSIAQAIVPVAAKTMTQAIEPEAAKTITQNMVQEAARTIAQDLVPVAAKTIMQEIVPGAGAVRGQLFAGGEIAAVDTIITEHGGVTAGETVRIDPFTGKVQVDESAGKLSYYKLEVIPPGEQSAHRDETLAGGVGLATYLQLPKGLPARIRRLAHDITAGLSDPRDKARAVERYLGEKYTYSLSEPDWPAKDADFVDHFLFEQKVGYCDHFSTAMAVMLRTLGVPARWVKGYAPGLVQLTATDSASAERPQPYVVTVRNLDAHSWVEVWVPGSGWVSFDPTPGFPGMQSASTNGNEVKAGMAAASAAKPDITPSPDKAGWAGKGTGWSWIHFDDVRGQISRLFSSSFIWAAVSAPIVLWAALFAWRTGQERLRAPHWFVLRGLRRGRRQQRALTRVLARIWRQVEREHGAMLPQQTYREYVQSVRSIDDRRRTALSELAHMTEKLFYDTAELPFWIPRRHLSRMLRELSYPAGGQYKTG